MDPAEPLTTGASGPPPPAGTLGRRLLGGPLAGRTWAELLYALAGVPLGVAGFLYAAATVYVGGLLAITLVGLPLIAAGVLGARRLGELHRGLARRLLGVEVATPVPFRPASGLVGWIRSGLGDAAGWRAMLYLMAKLPVAVLTFGVAAAFWGYGLLFASYAVWRPMLPAVRDSQGAWHRGAQLPGDYYVDTWPRIMVTAALGVALVLAAPWVVRGVLALDRWLVGSLLSPTRLSQRVRDLEETRAHAVDDAAAALRRIERDLHDGAQARLVALAMKLGMAKEELEGDDPQAVVARARILVDTAHRNAKEAIVELRDLARGIHPPVLDSGLDAGLAALAARSAVPVGLRVDVPDRPSPAIETIAYFCAAELLTNVAKHSQARHATVEATQRDGVLRLVVADDGRGGAHVAAGAGRDPGGTGLAGLADRVRTVDGRLEIASPPGGPTVVTVELPSHA
jgi:signal transduction histidine kinase